MEFEVQVLKAAEAISRQIWAVSIVVGGSLAGVLFLLSIIVYELRAIRPAVRAYQEE